MSFASEEGGGFGLGRAEIMENQRNLTQSPLKNRDTSICVCVCVFEGARDVHSTLTLARQWNCGSLLPDEQRCTRTSATITPAFKVQCVKVVMSAG